MFNERGERSRVHPDDLRFLLLLVKQCREARRQRRTAEAKNLPPDTVAYHRGRCGEALFSLQAAKKLMRVEWIKTVDSLVENAKFYQRNVITGAYGRRPFVDASPPTYRQRLDDMIRYPANARLHHQLMALRNDIFTDAQNHHRLLTSEEEQLLAEIRHYVRQVEAIIPWESLDRQPDSWFSSEPISKAMGLQVHG